MPHGRIDLQGARHTFFEHLQCLSVKGTRHTVDNEARSILCTNGHFPPAIDPLLCAIHHSAVGQQARNDLDQGQQRSRIEEMDPEQLLRMTAPHGKGGNAQTRGVGGQNTCIRNVFFQLLKKDALGLQIFNNGLDHKLTACKRTQILAVLNAAADGFLFLRADPAFFDQPVHDLVQCFPGPHQCLRLAVEEKHLFTCLCSHLRDPRAHGSRSCDPDHLPVN